MRSSFYFHMYRTETHNTEVSGAKPNTRRELWHDQLKGKETTTHSEQLRKTFQDSVTVMCIQLHVTSTFSSKYLF